MRARGGKLVVVDPRRSKTAEEADEWVPIRPGSDALLLAAIANVLVDEGLADPGCARQPAPRRSRRVRAAIAPFTPEPVARRDRHRRGDHPPARPRDRSRPDRCRVRPDRHHHDRVRVDRIVAHRRRQHLERQPRPAGWSRCSRRPSPAVRRHAAHPGSGRGFSIGRGHSRCQRTPRGDGRVPGGGAGRGDPRTRGRARCGRSSPSPAIPVLSTPNSDQLDAAARRPRVHGQRRHVPERDDPPRRRRPASALAAAALALRRAAAAIRGPQRRQLLRAGPAARRRPARRVGDHRQAGADRAGSRGRRRSGRDRRRRWSPDWSEGVERPVALERCRAERRRAARRNSPPSGRRGPERDARLRCSARARSATASDRTRTGRRSTTCSANPHGRDFGAARRAAARDPAHAERQDRAGAPGAHRRPRSAGGGDRRAGGEGPRARRPTAPAQQQLVDAQHRGAGEGQAALHAPGPSRRRRATRARRRCERHRSRRGSVRSSRRSR